MTPVAGARRALAVATGGVAGTGLRYLAGEVWPVAVASFPATTLAVNLAGSFLLAAWAAIAVVHWPHGDRLHAFVAIGALGSFTTFSAVAVETSLLMDAGRSQTAGAYLGLTVLGGAVAALGGAVVGRRLGGSPSEPL